MSRCPFWSTVREKVQCYEECPMLIVESSEGKNGEHCIFQQCTDASSINFSDIIKEDYSFLNLSMYEDEKVSNSNY
ncbi:hypothetical protein psyc5s11_36880 [Clostridium gelidum]|uniref:Uncharacterized protein n=1 Tax=Clostridium gelidum TaxID=704125 RepID=A0ABM7T6G4_9CLOT|nr:hypothetical protein [Clostridium gelidum]BCZ47621.1 hypothetical protein psyc5s11_36880 [Clostridium gelidum]